MRTQIVTGDPQRLRQGMTNTIATISLVTDLDNLLSPQTGIYVNPGNDGIGWERPVSMEIIDPRRGPNKEVQIDAGLRIRGAYSRTKDNPKHSFRLFFRSVYGASKLNFPLFDEEGASVFDKVDLRTSQNYSWSGHGDSKDTFVRETFSRDAQREMGVPYTRSRYYHLYINGIYWGLYQTQERSEADYASTYMGGKSSDWDCIKSDASRNLTAADGTFDAYHALHNLAVTQGFSGIYSNNYQRVKGCYPDGTPNPAYPVYLDEDNLICYMLCTYYTGDPDSPLTLGGTQPNNMYGLFSRAAPDGFKWFRHDAEHSLGANGSYPVTCDLTQRGVGITNRDIFNPATLHQYLSAHPHYRLRFADLVQKHFYGNGIFTTARAQALFRSRMDEIDVAIIGESARWGRGKTRDADWLPACNSVLNNYLSQRREIVLQQFLNRGWLQPYEVPVYSTNNAVVPAGYELKISAATNFLYTLDGSDPRLPDGAVNPAAILAPVITPMQPVTLIATNALWRYYDEGQMPPPSLMKSWQNSNYPDTSWRSGNSTLGYAGANTPNPVTTLTRRFLNGESGTQVTTTYLRRTFNCGQVPEGTHLVIDILRDDGAVLYLNGTEILRENMPEGVINYDTYASSVVGPPGQNTFFRRTVAAAHLLHEGNNVLAVELHQCHGTSTDLYFNMAMYLTEAAPEPVSARVVVSVTDDFSARARTYVNGEWGALAEAEITLYRAPVDYSQLRVTELMYAPRKPAEESPYVNDDFAWLELRNMGEVPLPLTDVAITKGITHLFDATTLAPGQRLVLSKNIEALATLYPTNNILLRQWNSGNLARKGEQLTFATPGGTNILTFTYSNEWYPETYNTGRSIVVVDTAAAEPLWSTALNWRPSRGLAGGTPGDPDVPLFTTIALSPDNTQLQLGTLGLEGVVDLWFSSDLQTWTPCATSIWTRSGDTLIINLQAPALAGVKHGFFRIRQRD